ncbi:MAG: bifunctional riboflavin kinase/FAD synthetase [Thermodesulfobacteriota bacterium]
MQRVEGLENINGPYKNAVVTIGNFDGVHKGHQALFGIVRATAGRIGGTSVVITFEPHPARVVGGNGRLPLITMYEQKIELIAACGMDVCLCIPFTREFAEIPAGEFVDDILIGRLGMKVIVVGKDYAFGKGREGNVAFLRDCAARRGFEVICAEEVPSADGLPRISSTVIRETVGRGDMESAYQLLGRYYQIRGKVVAGRDRGGKSLGFPTANLELADELCPPSGVYAVYVHYRSERFAGVANIGYSPTFDDHIFTVEVHILDFDRQIRGENIRVDFVKRLREEKKFSGIDELKLQIQKDIDLSRSLLR